MIKKFNLCVALTMYFSFYIGFSQENANNRLDTIKASLESIAEGTVGLHEKVDFNVSNTNLTDFVSAVANLHKINISLDSSLGNLQVSNNFSNATVVDILLYLCKEYSLTIDFTGNILSLKKYTAPKEIYVPKNIVIDYDAGSELLSMDLNKDSLAVVFKKLVDITGKNIVFTPGLESQKLSVYLKNVTVPIALQKIAYTGNLVLNQSRDGIYLFEPNELLVNKSKKTQRQRPNRIRSTNFYYKVLDSIEQSLDVDFENTDIDAIVQTIGLDLNINMFTTASLKEAGKASIKSKEISFDLLLAHVFENTKFTFKKENGSYFFGEESQLSLRNNVIIPLQHRSIEMMDSGQSSSNRSSVSYGNNSGNTNYNSNSGNRNFSNTNDFSNNSNNRSGSNSYNSNTSGAGRQNLNTQNSQSFGNYASKSEALVNILPKDIIADLEIKTDLELNSFVVSGPQQNIERFKKFIRNIDKPVPVILIEVMFIEYTKNSNIETGISWGIGEEPLTTNGGIFPSADLAIGATTINKIIGGFSGFGTQNLGKVVPNFYSNIKAMESNGNVNIKSTPKLSTLNGHHANLSIGETTYYVVTNTDFIGSQIPQTSRVTNYQPIDAQMALDIMPLVSGDGNITMSINVIQSNFNGKRVDENAPPGINSREFSSTVRVKDQDVIILGGLEEDSSNESGTGVPFLARVPIIKWFFSSKKKEKTKKKLSILIKPTIIK